MDDTSMRPPVLETLPKQLPFLGQEIAPLSIYPFFVDGIWFAQFL
jgi:hypothetical protein